MVDYAPLKVPELKKLLQDRALPISGNKSDLLARLQEDDKKRPGVVGMSSSSVQILERASIETVNMSH